MKNESYLDLLKMSVCVSTFRFRHGLNLNQNVKPLFFGCSLCESLPISSFFQELIFNFKISEWHQGNNFMLALKALIKIKNFSLFLVKKKYFFQT